MKTALITIILTLATAALAFTPGTYDQAIQAGEDYRLTLSLKDSGGTAMNLTGYSYAAQLRATQATTGTLYANYSASVTSAVGGTVAVSLSKAQTSNLAGKTGYWDLKQTDSGGKATYVLAGKAVVTPRVTP